MEGMQKECARMVLAQPRETSEKAGKMMKYA